MSLTDCKDAWPGLGSRLQRSLAASGFVCLGTSSFASAPEGLVQSRLQKPLTGSKKRRLSDESILDHQNESGMFFLFFRPRLQFVSNIQVGEISHQKSLKTKYSVNLGSVS